MVCGTSASPKNIPMQIKGSTLGAFVMMLRTAGLKAINGHNLTSLEAISKKLSPLVTKDDCNFDFYASLLVSLEFPFIFQGKFSLFKADADFTKMAFTELSQNYEKNSFEKVFGTLASCGGQCSAIMMWRKKSSSLGSSILKSATLLVKFDSSTPTGTIQELYSNAKISFADPQGTDATSRRKDKVGLCYEETVQGVITRACLDEVYIFKRAK